MACGFNWNSISFSLIRRWISSQGDTFNSPRPKITCTDSTLWWHTKIEGSKDIVSVNLLPAFGESLEFMIFSQCANNNLLLALSRTSPGIANTCLHWVSGSISFSSTCKFQGHGALCITTTSSTFFSDCLIQLDDESRAHEWQVDTHHHSRRGFY